jgi:hypothetical protein
MNPLVPILLAFLSAAPAHGASRVVETVVPDLLYGPGCRSEVELRNLGTHAVDLMVEGHRESGALVPVSGQSTGAVHLAPGHRHIVRLELESGHAWLAVRETLAKGMARTAVAAAGKTECVDGNVVSAVTRDAAFPSVSPSFRAPARTIWATGETLLLINTSESQARFSACYSTGNLVSDGTGKLVPVCSHSIDTTVPAYGTRYLPIETGEAALVALRTAGAAIVLQMLQPAAKTVQLYRVDSRIDFGSEVP